MRRRRTVVVALASTTLVLFGLARDARAGDSAAAQTLFTEARKLMAEGHYTEACPKLEESQRQDAGMGTLYNLADCYEHVGRVASAWAAFLDVAATARAAGQTARETDARQRASALEPELSRLVITVDERNATSHDLAVRRDGIDVGRAEWGVAVPVDPGEHEIVATAAGKRAWKTTAAVAAHGSRATVTVPALEDAPAEPPPPPSSATAPPAATAPLDASRGSTQRAIGVVVAAAGVVSAGIGLAFGVVSKSKHDDAESHCHAGNLCDRDGVELRSEAISAGNASTVAFVLGGIGVAAGAVLYFTAPRPGRGSVGVAASPSSVGFVGRFE